MTNQEITMEAIRAAAKRRANATLGAALAEYERLAREPDDPGVLWRGTLALRDGTKFEATIEATPPRAVFRQPTRERVNIEDIHPDYWRRAVVHTV